MILGPHTITIRRATTTEDEYGNQSADWASATSTTVSGCSVQPLNGLNGVLEVTVGRDTAALRRWQLFAPDGTDLQFTDRVEFDGDTFEVDGEAQRWGFPPLSHVVALLRKGDG